MISELEAKTFERVRPLLEGMEHNLIMTAVVEGTSPGRIWVDDPKAPRTALMSTPEGHFLAGRRPEGEAGAALREFITETILPAARRESWDFFCLHYPERDWQETVAGLVCAKQPVWDHQQYFVLKAPRVDWREGLAAEYAMRPVDSALLDQRDLHNVRYLRSWASGNFGSIPEFLTNGFGFCIVHGDRIVSWCMSDCVSGNRCEVGIHTDEGHRRRGFATRAAAAAVEHCLSVGLTHIGWHCWSGNAASAATARAVGFEKVLDHHAIHVWFKERNGPPGSGAP